MKILHIAYSDSNGGAARALSRLNKSLNDNNHNVESEIYCRSSKNINKIRYFWGKELNKYLYKESNVFHSTNLLPSFLSKKINDSNYDIVHLHWIGGDTISLLDISKIKKPIVWTLHDMWGFCASEHVSNYKGDQPWKKGSEGKYKGIDRYLFNKKKKYIRDNITIVAPSNWLGECAKESTILFNNKIVIIPNNIDLNIFKPLDKLLCRDILNLPLDKKIILFGAINPAKDDNKGCNILFNALLNFSKDKDKDNYLCVVFGQDKPSNIPDIPLDMIWLGHIHDDITLTLIYNSADVMVVPSKIENLPQTATEAQACSLPVVAFNCSGLPDVIEHKVTGYLVEPYNERKLYDAILWILTNSLRARLLGDNGHKRAERLWGSDVISNKYINLYRDILGKINDEK